MSAQLKRRIAEVHEIIRELGRSKHPDAARWIAAWHERVKVLSSRLTTPATSPHIPLDRKDDTDLGDG